MDKPEDGLYIMLISVHGLIRGHDLELGRDADTGGQTKYVVELARALAECPDVGRVDLVTRQVIDKKIDDDYARPIEPLSPHAAIVRLACGPRRYLRKEVLWPYLDGFIDNVLQHLRQTGRVPDLIHGHYADAGYVATRLVQLLGVPLVFTGHSLGRVKRQRLLENGQKPDLVDQQYNFAQRIEAEEIALGNANLVITSTNQEVDEQYNLYDNYQPRRMTVIPPGVDLKNFHPQRRSDPVDMPIRVEINRFLSHPERPVILAISRPDERKNIATLVRAFGESRRLRELANLVIVAGNRDDVSHMEKGSREVLSQLLLLIDRYDLYGLVAYPKHHEADDVADLFRIAAQSGGVFVNPALTEPFGLTLIEAAASGLPIVATEDGGPRDIIGMCKNGVLIDPLDADAMADALHDALVDRKQWQRWANSGEKAAYRYYTWESHVSKYLAVVKKVVGESRRVTDVIKNKRNRLPTIDRMVVCDIDNTLVGDDEGLASLLQLIADSKGKIGLAVATGRRIESAVNILKQYNVPVPDVYITAVGSKIHYGHRMVEDLHWSNHINYRWRPDAIMDLLGSFPGLRLQASSEQLKHKISFLIDPKMAPTLREISQQMRKRDLHAKIIYSHQAYLDMLPVRASKGLAVRYIGHRWGIPPERILVAGDSGNDEEMLKGNTLGVVVGNYSTELSRLRRRPGIYFAEGHFAWGVQEGIHHYNFLAEINPLSGIHLTESSAESAAESSAESSTDPSILQQNSAAADMNDSANSNSSQSQ